MTPLQTQLLDLLKGHSNRRNSDTLSMTDVLMHLQTGQQVLHNGRRMNAQVDMHLKERCGDKYESPKEDEMGNNLLNNVFVGDDAIKQLAKALTEGDELGSQTNAPATPSPKGNPMIPDWLKAVALAGLTAVGTAGIMNCLGDDDTDTRNVYDISAVPFDPDAPIGTDE